VNGVPIANHDPFVPSEVEGRVPGAPHGARASTSLGTNGAFVAGKVD